MMASGKSTIGKLLSEKLNFDYLDTDLIIERQENKTCNEIFKDKGEKYFRSKELKLISYLSKSNTVIATGGGFPIFNNNMDKLLKIGITIYLKTSPHEIYRRIGNNKSRPLFQGLASLTKSISKRELIYERAHQIISTDNKPFSEIINEILSANR